MANETVTRAVFEAEERGVAQTATALNRLGGAAGDASSATDKFTKTTTTSAKEIASVERRVDALQRQLAGAPAAWSRYERSMRAANDGLQAGRLDAEEYARSVQRIQEQLQRVVAPRLDLDVSTSGLSALLGATDKVSAAQREAASEALRMAQARKTADEEIARSQELLARETARHAAEIDALRSVYDPAHTAAKRMSEEVENLARLEREGIEIAGGYEAALDRIVLKYDESAQAARRAAEAQEDFIRRARDAQNEANARLAADANQGAFNSLLGVDMPSSGSARASASVFEEAAREAEQMRLEAERLRAELDPLGTAFDQMTSKLSAYAEMQRRGLISNEEFAEAQTRARQTFEEFSTSLTQQGPPAASILERAFSSLRNTMLSFVGAYAGLQGLRMIGGFADQWSDLSARVGLAVGSMDAAAPVMDRLSTIADDTYSSVNLTTEAFLANSTAMRELGYSTREQLNFLSAQNDALVVSGARGDRARQVQDALSRAMALGSLRGNELNAVLLHGDRVAQALAAELGVGVNELRRLGQEGEITGEIIHRALTGRAVELRAEAEEMPAVLEDAGLRFRNAMLRMVGRIDGATGATSTLAAGMIFLADNMETVGALALSAGVGIATAFAGPALAAVQTMTVAVGTRLVGAFNALTAAIARNPLGAVAVAVTTVATALTLFRDEIVPVQGEIATLGDYMRATATISGEAWSDMTVHVNDWSAAAIGAIATYVGTQNREANLLPESWSQAWDEIIGVFGRATRNVINTLLVIPSAGAAARIALVETWAALPEGLGAATIEAARLVLLTIEEMVDGAISLVNQAIRSANERFGLGLREIPGIVGTISNYLSPLPEEAAEAGEAAGKGLATRFSEAFKKEHASRRSALDDIMSSITDGFETIRERANEIGAARTEVDVLNDALLDTAPAATGAGDALSAVAKKARDAFEEQRRALGENVAGLQRQIDMFDATRGETAALDLVVREMARAWSIAREAGLNAIPPETLAAIEEAAAQVGILTDRLDALGTIRSAVDEFFPFEKAVREASRLQSMLDDTTMSLTEMERIALQMKIGQTFDNAQKAVENLSGKVGQETEKMRRDLMDNIGSTLLDIFDPSATDSFFDRITKGLADIGRQFAELGKKNLLEALFGSASTYTSANDNRRSIMPAGFPQGYGGAVATPLVDTRHLTALNDNLSRTSRSALDVARQFDGLNERADSKVLDSFMRASGQWNNLSAADTAWCAAFANAAIAKAGGQGSGSNLASSFLGWGTATNAPQIGDIVVLKPQARGASGHVGFVAGFGDGSVQIFGGNQSNAANTKSFGLDQVVGYRTGEGLRGAVAGGFLDAQRQMANGQAGFDPWAGLRQKTTGAAGVQGGIFGPQGQAMLGVGGAALGSFFGGMQSGNPLMGGLSGAMSGLGAAGSIASAFPALAGIAGPVGMIGGAALGLLGGIFGRSRRKREERRQREEMERQQRDQARAQLRAQQPAILELEDTLLDRASGSLEKERQRMDTQIAEWQQLAKTAKSNAEIRRLAEMREALSDYMDRLFDQVRLTTDSVVDSMLAGRGLEPEFAQAAASVREASLAIRNYLADLVAATSETAVEVGRARTAGQMQLLRQLSGAEEVTEVHKALDTLYGTAAALGPELQKLGMSAEDAAAAIADHLNKGIGRLRDDFTTGIRGEIADTQGFGYLNQIRDLIDRRNEMRSDAVSLGADPALIDRWFQVQAQSIIDGTGLVGDAIDPLIDLFPELAEVLGESMAALERSLATATSDLRAAYNRQKSELEESVRRLEGFAAALAQYRDDIRLDRTLSPLSPLEKMTEAQERFRDVAEKAAQGDEEAQGQLIGLSRSYLDEAKSYYASSEQYYAIFGEVAGILASTEATALEEIDAAKAQLEILDVQVGALIDINESVLTVAEAIEAFNAAQAARDTAQAEAFEAYVKALNPEAAIPSYEPPDVNVTPAPKPATPAEPTHSYHQGRAGNWQSLDVYGRQMRVFVYLGETEEKAKRRAWSEFQAGIRDRETDRLVAQNRLGGLIQHSYQRGGMVGNGLYDVDSVLARYAGGGNIALAGGEFVTTARGVNASTLPVLDFINRNHRLPEIRMPQVRASGGDQALLSEVRALRDEVRALRGAVGFGAIETVKAVREGTAVSRQQAGEMKRRNAA